MNRISALVSFCLLAGSFLLPVQAQERGRGAVHVPDTSLEDPSDIGERAHTNHRLLIQPKIGLGPQGGMTPAQIQSFYGLPSTGGNGVIAIVDAYDYPTALRDFNTFAAQFGLPQETSTSVTSSSNKVFQVVYQGGKRPRSNTGWSQEAALDIQWAHALAPSAKIVLVEAQSNSFSALLAAVDAAKTFPGVRQVSMSWGGTEFSTEASNDHHFNYNGVVFFAASGDTGGQTIYPSASPNVVAVGGTSVSTNNNGAFLVETGWSDSGGGPSAFESKPAWQNGISGTGSSRSIPDLAADADPNTGVAVYAPLGGGVSGWMVFGGTSVATPCVAAMVNLNGMVYANSAAFLTAVYAGAGSANFRDILSGNNGYAAQAGWDFVTGLGSPQGTGF